MRKPKEISDNKAPEQFKIENWPVDSVLIRLADAVDHLLSDHDCDMHGYEGLSYAVFAARYYAEHSADLAAHDPVNSYPTVVEAVHLLEAAGFGAPGKPNTLLAMVKEVLAARSAGVNARAAAEEFREELAALCHEQWSGWMRFLFECCDFGGDKVVIPADRFKRWQRQMKAAYADLPESEKDSDRAEADRFIAIISRHCGAASVPSSEAEAMRRAIIAHCKKLEVEYNWQLAGEIAGGICEFVENLKLPIPTKEGE